ncbi:OsmC family protein [Pseudonocardia phyllosphaerae]|uniref:OsmC family protein n=1 Tax=Pseudonocardia phyllosphaerae TaxID=3390502 RepID=UPI00397B779B
MTDVTENQNTGPSLRDALKGAQDPLKQQYRDDPESAVVTLHADGELGAGVACKVDTGRAIAEAGLHPATGGDGTQLCSGDMLLEALVACAGVTLRAVATALELEVTGAVRAEGDLDFRGTLGVAKDAPVGFRAIRLTFDLDTHGATEEQRATLVKLTERYCVVLQTIKGSATTSVEITGS